MTTDRDHIHDICYEAAYRICKQLGLRSGIDRIAQSMTDAAMDEAEEIKAECNERQVELQV